MEGPSAQSGMTKVNSSKGKRSFLIDGKIRVT
jgi:hypothetical protein